MARKEGEKSLKDREQHKADESIAEEWADILWVLVCLANQTGVNLEKAIEASFEKKSQRDRNRHINNKKLSEKDEQ